MVLGCMFSIHILLNYIFQNYSKKVKICVCVSVMLNFALCAETAMGRKIYAQSDSESEYVKCVYRYAFCFLSKNYIFS